MTENYEHYISRNIRKVYRRKLAAPGIYVILLAVLWFVTPLPSVIFPQEAKGFSSIEERYKEGEPYVSMNLTDLYFTGYISTLLGQTNGYYYYTLAEDKCMFVLLSPGTCEEGLPYIQELSVRAKVLARGEGYDRVSDLLADDLEWTAEGLKSKVSPYFLSEPACHRNFTMALGLLFGITGVYGIMMLLIYMMYILFPVISPPCRQLGRFGRASELLAQAEEELATLPQLATEDMFITEHYFIEIAASGIAIVPIQEILWIYKYSTLHKIFWFHLNIFYTLHITANKRLYIQCPKNIKSDIDGIIDYLAEANHGILVGFSEENRLKVRKIQQPKLQLGKLFAFLERRK